MAEKTKPKNALVISYLTLRTVIGVLGITLPFLVSLGAILVFREGQQSSISAYYHTGMRDVFVGVLFVIGFFLLTYTGYDQWDNITGNLACIFAVGVALFPTSPSGKTTNLQETIGLVHLIFAAMFFLTLAFYSFYLFTKTDPKKEPSKQKKQRNFVYRACGVVMFLCILLMAIFHMLPDSSKSMLADLNPIYWLEAFAIVAFGASWFVKGENVLKDQ